MSSNNSHDFATRAIHAGYNPADNEGALTPPIHMTSTFAFDTVEQGAARFAGEESGHIYSRISNPTQELLEQRLASLENGEAALATASGMGAISAALWTLLAPGDQLIVDKTLYGCTFAFFQHGLSKFGVEVLFVDCTDHGALAAALTDKTRVVYFESPVNPNLRIIDIAAVAKIAHDYRADITVMVDNTYCTPALQRPLELGADLVAHSATKYLGGHGDLIAGALIGSADMIQQIRLYGLKDMTGCVIAPLTAFLIMRGLKTLELRMERHCQNALALAEQLQHHPTIAEVHYPGLSDSPYYEVASRQMSLPGGMLAFELHGGLEAGKRFMNSLELIQRAVSLGDAETLCQHPASMTHSTYTPEERARHGIAEGLIRISVGLESLTDIAADIEQALATAGGETLRVAHG
ncbi:MAG: methionine gamma-lyase [Halieaceae bacterium]